MGGVADRTVYGKNFSENGWRMVDTGSCVWVRVPGTAVTLQIREGQPAAILGAFAADYNAYLEQLRDEDSACWTRDNDVATSNHLSGTGMDLNWLGPGKKRFRLGISKEQAYPGEKSRVLDELLAFYEGLVFCGGEWSIRDWMHFQLGGNTYGANNVTRVQSFINRKIRADGFSTFRRGGVPRGGGTATQPSAPANPIQPKRGLTARVLYDIAVAAYGVADAPTLGFYEDRIVAFLQMLRDCGANTIDRRAMVGAQVFHEAGALRYVREIADGSAYEGRCRDLGNCQPGDGRRFRGRGWIQLTGRTHTEDFSRWMYDRGRAPTPTYFVGQPSQMETIDVAAQTAVFYLTVKRPGFMALADARNLEACTRAINGGLTGLADRRRFYDLFLSKNADLLDPPNLDPLEEVMALSVPSLSIYADPGEDDVPLQVMIAALDAHGPHEPYVEKMARLGDVDSIRRVARTADGRGRVKTPAAIKQARDVFATIDPALVLAAIPTPA